jgi:L-ribulose-5-phosphate 3-epimerase
MKKISQIGFIQGRLSELVDGKIQAFPWITWEDEFLIASKNGFHCMEWTLDQERLYSNPLLTILGQKQILNLCKKHNFSIPSLTGDCFMQAPFWKTKNNIQKKLKKDFLAIAKACSNVGIKILVVPLVDNGSIDSKEQEDILIEFLLENLDFFKDNNLQITFESDFTPPLLEVFINRLPEENFGINYDIGNSAALGYDPAKEFAAYGKRILNVHVKDRELFGTTVSLGNGNADFEQVFSLLGQIEYSGNFILQTARAINNDHVKFLCIYKDMTLKWMKKYNLKLDQDFYGT